MTTLGIGFYKRMNLDDKLSRIRDLDNVDFYDNLGKSFMHAYAGCLSWKELCLATVATLSDPISVHRAIRNRLAKLSVECQGHEGSDELVPRLIECANEGKLRPRVEACLSHLYLTFSPPVRLSLLQRWQDRGTSSAGARWLKAIESDPIHFSQGAVADYWQASQDSKAVRVLIRRADPEVLQQLLPDFIRRGVEGWAVGQAIIRLGSVTDDVWSALRENEPATFAYLCAKGLRSLTGDEAVQLVLDSPDEFYGGGKGLAIWSIGQLGLESALNELWNKLR